MTGPAGPDKEGSPPGPGLPNLPGLLGACLLVAAAALAERLWMAGWAAPLPLAAAAMLFLPVLLTRGRTGILGPGASESGLSLLEGLGAAAVLLPLFFVGVWSLKLFNSETPTAGELARGALFQVALVAVPEEFFFRGFLQRGLSRLWSGRRKLLGAQVGWGLPAAAALFALAHLAAAFRPGALLVFFPGLVFGWLWARRRSLVGPVLFHAACNLSLLWVRPGLF